MKMEKRTQIRQREQREKWAIKKLKIDVEDATEWHLSSMRPLGQTNEDGDILTSVI